MKHPRLILWYASIAPMFIMFFVSNFIELLCRLFIGLHSVFENLMFRYEIWAKYNEKGSIMNCPWKKTLKEVFIEGYEGK